MPHTHLPIHLIWATRFRSPWLESPVRARVFAYMSGICKNIRTPLRIAGGIEDHVHLLIELHPAVALAEAVRDIKANSSRFIHETWPELAEFGWQSDYAAFAVSKSAQADVYRYIENQAEHHKRRSVVDELRALCRRHEMDFDPNPTFE